MDQRGRLRGDGLQPVLHQSGDCGAALLRRGGLTSRPELARVPDAPVPSRHVTTLAKLKTCAVSSRRRAGRNYGLTSHIATARG